MTDGHRDSSVGERKLIWDEENRLLAVDDNGFVSNYWYDADGERTVKTSGESDQVYVNGVFSGGSTNTAKFSLYVSPYLVANQGGRYTKHIYAGSQRIVSKVGDFASYGSDPRRIEYAGANTDGLSVDYKSKYAAQQQVIKDNYKFFDVPYNGSDNDNYADGEGFCCNDGSMEAAVAKVQKAQTRAVSRSFKDPDNYENLQFFYHPDHLGSSNFITNLDGEVVQHIEYVPFGEVFIEERNNVWNTPYLFNAKEFDEETGMYYYGARYYDPRLSLWLSTDPMQEKYPNLTTYTFVENNPLNIVDPTGEEPVYNTKGAFLGTTSEGFKGEVLIYSGTEKVDFSKLTRSDAESKFPADIDTYDVMKKLDSGGMSSESHSKIWTHIVSQFEGMEVYDERFSMSQVQGGKIGHENVDGAGWETTFSPNNPNYIPKIIGTGGYSYESTVENIAASVIVHEWYSHGKKHTADDIKSHRLAYKNVINFKRLWNGTTDNYKRFNLQSLRFYTEKETGRKKVDPLYRNLYKRYVK